MFERLSNTNETTPDSTIDTTELNRKIKANQNGIVFFTGAGFSKAWNQDYPLGFDLFSIKDFNTIKNDYNFFQVAADLEIPVPQLKSETYEKDCYEFFQDIKFHFDIYKRYPSITPSFLDRVTLTALENEMRSFILTRFTALVGNEELKLITKKDASHPFSKYFNNLVQETAKFSFISTNYDLIIEKIFANNSKNIMLNRGVLDVENFENKNWCSDKIDLFKINGGFEIQQSGLNEFSINHSKQPKAPHIILPSKEQNYSDKYFESVFVRSANKLREADLLVFIGYSLPIEDQTIQFLLKNFKDSHNTNKEIVIIDYQLTNAINIMHKVEKLFPNIAAQNGIYAYKENFTNFVSDSDQS